MSCDGVHYYNTGTRYLNQTMKTNKTVELQTTTSEETLPEVFGVSRWSEDDILSYTVMTTKHQVSRDILMQMVREAMNALNQRCSLNDEVHWVCRIEGGHHRYINANVRDPNITRTHAHLLIGKEKITNSKKHPEHDWKWFHTQMTGKEKVWPHGIVHNEPYIPKKNGVLEHGALVYNLKAPRGRLDNAWDDNVVISRRLRRKLKMLASPTWDLTKLGLAAIYEI